MSEYVMLRAADGHELSAYVALPAGEPVAALVVVQEIFGVNAHVRSVAEGYAKDGFLAVAPALFDRVETGVELSYQGADLETARNLMQKLDLAHAVADVQAALEYAAETTSKNVGVIGYCYGGTLAWLAATRLRPTAAVGYYGGMIANFAGEEPTCPVMLHFGKQDAHIPAESVDKVKAAHPEIEVYWYDAGHGFNCDARASHSPSASREARARSLAFLKKYLV
jgi:carboxymethylenebutenolidase